MELWTVFRLECVGWVDDDLPMRYKFLAGRKSLSRWLRLAYQDTILAAPRGASGSSSPNVTMTAYVRDSLRAEARYDFSVRVQTAASVSLGDIDSQIGTAVEDGDARKAFTLISVSASHVSKNTSNVTAASGQRSQMIQWISRTVNMSSGAEFSAVSAPAGLLEEVTSFDDPRELTPTGRSQALSLLEAITSKATAAEATIDGVDTDATYKSSLAAVANVVDSASRAGASESERRAVTARAESVVNAVSNRQLSDAVEGEDRVEIKTDTLDLLTQKFAVESFGSASVALLDGTVVNMSSSISLESDVGSLSVSSLQTSGYPSQYNMSGSVSIRVHGSRDEELQVDGLAEPVSFVIRTDYVGDRVTCMFWNATEAEWSTAGVQTAGPVPGGVACRATHLTTFAIAEGVSLELNTFEASDVTTAAFGWENPIMVFTTACILAYIAAMAYFSRLDRRLYEKDAAEDNQLSERFWRKYNKMRRVQVSDRSVENFKLMSAWDLRRRHPWCSICCRHPGDFLTYTKRCTVLIVLVFNMMTVCALLLGTKQRFGPVPPTLGSAVVAVILAFPVPYFLNWAFRRGTPPEYSVSILKAGAAAGCLTYFLIALSAALGEADDGEFDPDADKGTGGDEEGEDIQDDEGGAERLEDAGGAPGNQGVEEDAELVVAEGDDNDITDVQEQNRSSFETETR